MKKGKILLILLLIFLLGAGIFVWASSQNGSTLKNQEQSTPTKQVEEVAKTPQQSTVLPKETKKSEVKTEIDSSQVEETPVVNQEGVERLVRNTIQISNVPSIEEQPIVGINKEEPKIVSVKLDKQEGIAYTSDKIKVDVLTQDMIASEVVAELVQFDGTSLNPKVEVNTVLNHQSASLELVLNDNIPQGNYQVKVSVNRYELVEKLSYKLNRKLVPAFTLFSIDKNQSVEKTATEVEVSLDTFDIENNEKIVLELLNENKEVQLTEELVVNDNTAKTKIQLVDTLPFGKYIIRASYRDLKVEKEYEILYLPVPEILDAKISKNEISYGYNESIRIELALKDIEENSDMEISLLDENKQPVDGYNKQTVKTGKDGLDYVFALSPLSPGNYIINVKYVDKDSVFKDINLSVSGAKNNWKELLDYSQKNDGIYWFDELNRAYPDKDTKSPFDPKKPTIIFIHGWQDGSVKKNYSPDFNYVIEYDVKEGNKNVKKQVTFNSVKAWIDAGYNVGVYNWVQIADEAGDGWFSIPYSAEAKIWTTNYQYYKIPMRYRLNNGKFINETSKTAADLFVEKYLEAMKDYQGDHITLAGHSLGNQMVLRSTSMILERVENNQADKAIVPDRLTLLDPYYSGNGDKFATYKGQTKTNSQVAALMAKEFADKNIVIEMFKSSMLTTNSITGDVNKELENIAAYNRISPDLLGITAQHSAGHQLYFWAKHSNNSLYISNDAEVASLMGNNFRVEQTEGKATVDPFDDKAKITKSGTYIPVEDIILKDDKNNILSQTDKENATELTVQAGEYIRVDAEVLPVKASSKVVVIEEVDGDKDSVQIAYDGHIKGLKAGNVLLRAVVVKRDNTGAITGKIEKYFRVVVQ